MSTPASYSQSSSTVSSNVSTINLPILNKSLTGVNIATINANNGFIDININALTGRNGSISIAKPGMAPVNYTGLVNKIIHLGSDNNNTIPFIGKQTITIILNAPPNETILVNQLTYDSTIPINYKKCAFIFLTVYFILTLI